MSESMQHKQWVVSVTETGERTGCVSISGPGVFEMSVNVSHSMLDFFKHIESIQGIDSPSIGCVLVPMIATKEMWDAWHSSPNNSEDDDVNMASAYSAMLQASPFYTLKNNHKKTIESLAYGVGLTK